MVTRTSLILLVALVASVPLPAQQSTNRTVNARADLARKEITIGDQLYLTVSISAPPGTVVYPVSGAGIEEAEGIEVIREEDLTTVAETPELLLEQRFLITSFDTGYLAIPPLPVYFDGPGGGRDTAFTADLRLTVRAAVVTDEEDIMPIKPIIEEPRNWRDYWWLFILVGLLLAVIAFRELRKRQTAVPPPPPPPPPPHEVALARLNALEQRQLWQSGDTDTYYVELTAILRTYLQDRFGIPAREMTTRQIVGALDRQGLNREQRGELSELLQLSDLVKFAKATPAEELHPQGLERVRAFVTETRPQPEPEAAVTDPKEIS